MARRTLFIGLLAVGALLPTGACSTESEEAAAESEAAIVGGDKLHAICASLGNPACCQASWTGEYFTNEDLQGPPALIRTDAQINFDWGTGGPIPGVVDHYSARWTMNTCLPAGRYLFTTEADDGVRLYVDGQPRIDWWQQTSPVVKQVAVDLDEGAHTIRLEYFEQTGSALARLNVQEGAGGTTSDGPWTGFYYANDTLSGQPVFHRTDPIIDFSWGDGSPAPGIPNDHFSVIWSKDIQVDRPTSYRFTTTTDDGVRLYVDGAPVIDLWIVTSPQTREVVRQLDPGKHTIVAMYFEATGGATAKISLGPVGPTTPPPCNDWRGEYFSNEQLAGAPVVRCDRNIDFDWAGGAPIPQIPADHFSVRWTKRSHFDGGLYKIHTKVDDRIRILLDDRSILETWAPGEKDGQYEIPEGDHTLSIEYVEVTSTAYAHVDIEHDCSGVGNLMTCDVPNQQDNGAWVDVLRQDANGNWVKHTFAGAINANGYLPFFGLPVDACKYGLDGEPYLVRQYQRGGLTNEAIVRVKPNQDNVSPPSWNCPTHP